MPRVKPPLHLLAHLLAMWALDRWLPGPRWLPADAPWTHPARLAGAALVIGGWALVLRVIALFARHGTALRPGEESSALVVEGPFRWSRNPIYLGLAASVAGYALALGSTTPWLALPSFVAILRMRFIRLEEGMLAARFGPRYDEYRARVRRWL